MTTDPARPHPVPSHRLAITRWGIRLVLAPLLLLFVAVALLGVGAIPALRGPELIEFYEKYLRVFPYLIIASSVLAIVGRLLCLTTPTEVEGTQEIIGAVMLDSYPIVLRLLIAFEAERLLRVFRDREWLLILSPVAAAIVGNILFVLFLRKLAQFLDRPQVVSRALSVIVFAVLAVVTMLVPLVVELPNVEAYLACFAVAMLFGLLWLLGYTVVLLKLSR